MTEPSNIAQAAQYLAQRYEARESMDVMLQPFAPTTIADAYQVQEAFLNMLGKSRGAIGGYKVAYTSDEMRRLRGINTQNRHPVPGKHLSTDGCEIFSTPLRAPKCASSSPQYRLIWSQFILQEGQRRPDKHD